MKLNEYYSVITGGSGRYALVQVLDQCKDGRFLGMIVEGQFAGNHTTIDDDDMIIAANASLEVFDAD